MSSATPAMRERAHRWASGLVGVALAANAVANTLWLRERSASRRASLGRDFMDDVTRFQMGLDGLRARLASQAEVRYVTSVPNHEIFDTRNPLEHSLPLFAAQYALAPTLLRWRQPPAPAVAPGREGTFVLANFPNAASLDAFLGNQPHELCWRREGLALLRRP